MCERIICPDLWVRRGKLSLMPEINVFSPQVWNSRIVHVSWQVYYRGRLLATYWPTISCICKICHLQISHNAPYLPPKFCITFFFHFSWVLQPSQEKLKTMLMQNFFGGAGGGQIRCFMGNVQMVYGLFYDWPSGWPLAQWTLDLCWYFLILLLELKSVLEFLKIKKRMFFQKKRARKLKELHISTHFVFV